MSLMIRIANIDYSPLDTSFHLREELGEPTRCSFQIRDDGGDLQFQVGQQVSASDSNRGLLFSGFVQSVEMEKVLATTTCVHAFFCLDYQVLAEQHFIHKSYINQYAGLIVADLLQSTLVPEGVVNTVALDLDTTQAELAQGTLTQCFATDRDLLELAPAGQDLTSEFVGANPPTFAALKFQGSCVEGYQNAFAYRKIYNLNLTIQAGDSIEYDLWVQSDSPECKAAVDFVCQDGSSWRDASDAQNDFQGIAPHPQNDLAPYAQDQWYHRAFGVPPSLVGKHIFYFSLGFEGERAGTYTAYFRRIRLVNGPTIRFEVFNDISTSAQSNLQLQVNGYRNLSLSVVQAHERVYQTDIVLNLTPLKLVRSSVITWEPDTVLASDASLKYQATIDQGAVWQPLHAGFAFPLLLAGIYVNGQTLIVRRILTFGRDPTLAHRIGKTRISLQSAYSSNKVDIIRKFLSQAEFASGTSSNMTISPNGGIQLAGTSVTADDPFWHLNGNTNWYGNGSPYLFVRRSQFALNCNATSETRVRLDLAGQHSNFVVEVDVQVHTGILAGLVYRTTTWINADSTYAYGIELSPTNIALVRGTNSTTSATTGLGSSTISLINDSWHRLKIICSGSSHRVFIDDIEKITVTDSTFLGAGYFGLRNRNTSSATYSLFFDNFGVVETSIAGSMSGTWQSPAIDISGANSYGGSTVNWDATTVSDTSFLQVQASTDNGTTFLDLTNGGALAALTIGQSLVGKTVILKMNFSANNAVSLPMVSGLSLRVLGNYRASGTRISPPLSLALTEQVGSSVVSWNALEPPGTTVSVDVSLNGGSTWQSVTNRTAIPGLNVGDLLTGKQLLTRCTLTSNEPTLTPQLQDISALVTPPEIGLGQLLLRYEPDYLPLKTIFRTLAEQSNYLWTIRANKRFLFQSRDHIPAPWTLTSSDVLRFQITIIRQSELYRNRQIITNVLDSETLTETRRGDRQTASWAFAYSIAEPPTILLNDQMQTVGRKGLESGKDFYWELGSNIINQSTSSSKLTEFDLLSIHYSGQFCATVIRDNSGQFAGTTSQTQYAALTGGSGVVEKVYYGEEIKKDAAIRFADANLQNYGMQNYSVKMYSRRAGLLIGHYLIVLLPQYGIDSIPLVIRRLETSVSPTQEPLTGEKTHLYWYEVEACVVV